MVPELGAELAKSKAAEDNPPPCSRAEVVFLEGGCLPHPLNSSPLWLTPRVSTPSPVPAAAAGGGGGSAFPAKHRICRAPGTMKRMFATN